MTNATGDRAGGATKYIEPRISLVWLLSTAGLVVTTVVGTAWNTATESERSRIKMETLTEAVKRLENSLESRDARIQALAHEVQANRSMNEVQNTRIAHIEEQMRATRAFVGVKP